MKKLNLKLQRWERRQITNMRALTRKFKLKKMLGGF
jgi:hypothetical protein